MFRIDTSAAALSEAFGGLVDAERNGRVARTSIAPTLEALFLKGPSAWTCGSEVLAKGYSQK